jgi:hypothetical protein
MCGDLWLILSTVSATGMCGLAGACMFQTYWSAVETHNMILPCCFCVDRRTADVHRKHQGSCGRAPFFVCERLQLESVRDRIRISVVRLMSVARLCEGGVIPSDITPLTWFTLSPEMASLKGFVQMPLTLFLSRWPHLSHSVFTRNTVPLSLPWTEKAVRSAGTSSERESFPWGTASPWCGLISLLKSHNSHSLSVGGTSVGRSHWWCFS